MDAPGPPLHIIHQDVLAQGHRRGEVGFPLANLRHTFDEIDQIIIVGQHEGVYHYVAAAAERDFSERLL